MSKLNPNAGEFVPSFTTTAAAVPVVTGPDVAVSPPSSTKDPEECFVIQYPIEFLLQFRSICDRIPCELPDVVKDKTVKKRLGEASNKGFVYSVGELLQFQHLYNELPPDLECTETVLSMSAAARQNAKAAQKARLKEKRQQLRSGGYPPFQMQYDPTLMCYFNPAEYAAGINMGVFTSGNGQQAANGSLSDGTVKVVDPVPTSLDQSRASSLRTAVDVAGEAKEAENKLNNLLESINEPEVIDRLLEFFQEIPISCIETLKLVIELLFDRAVADPTRSDLFAQLLAGASEKTPEFKDGAKTINFRRILLTKCYETLVDEPSVTQSEHCASPPPSDGDLKHKLAWRRQNMLKNVGLIGELFRRQLLTENIMHVCIAMMLDDDKDLKADIVEAACQLISLVGDLLDGSSPASRRTMDEYFQVFGRLCEHPKMPPSLKSRIEEIQETRAAGWIKKRQEGSTRLTDDLQQLSRNASPAKRSPVK